MSLPTISASIDCGNCSKELTYNEGTWDCEECRLTWDTSDPFDDTEAVFTDPDEAACGHARNFTPYGGVLANGRHYRVIGSEPCILPASHTGRHATEDIYIWGEEAEAANSVPASVDAGSSGVPTLPLDGVPTPE